MTAFIDGRSCAGRVNTSLSLPERLHAMSVYGPGDCRTWARGVNGRGYGNMFVGGVTKSAHRVAYEALVGPIPEGLHIDHLCRNKLCINPLHLEPVTCAENNRRGLSPEITRRINGDKTHCKNGHEFTPSNTYLARLKDGRTRRSCRICSLAAAQKYHLKVTGGVA